MVEKSIVQEATLHRGPLDCLRSRQADPPRINGEYPKDVQGFTVKAFPLDAPTEVVTPTGPVVAPDGTAHLIVVFDHEV